MAGPELLVELHRSNGPLAARLQGALREAVRAGRLAPGERLPSTRTLARDAEVARRLVVEAYTQLVAEGWLAARQGAGTSVAGPPRERSRLPAPEPAPELVGRLPYDFFPGSPDLASFPRALWLRTLREVLRSAPDEALHYPDVAGTPEVADISMMQTRSVTYTFDGPGPFAYACHAAGHYEAGMRGTITVEP